jgi:hypothetical protein
VQAALGERAGHLERVLQVGEEHESLPQVARDDLLDQAADPRREDASPQVERRGRTLVGLAGEFAPISPRE